MSKHDLKDVKNNSESLFSKIRLFFSKIAVLVALIAIFYRNKDEIRDWFDSTPKEIIEEEKRKESVLQALLSIERNWVRKTENPTGLFKIIQQLREISTFESEMEFSRFSPFFDLPTTCSIPTPTVLSTYGISSRPFNGESRIQAFGLLNMTEKFSAFVGFGSCLDIFTSASELFAAMNYTEFPEPKEFGVLKSQNEFLSEFGYYFQQGAAAERNKD